MTESEVVTQLQAAGHPASFEYPGYVSIGGWAFGFEDGRLLGNDEEGLGEHADLDPDLSPPEAIVKFLRGLSHCGRLPWESGEAI